MVPPGQRADRAAGGRAASGWLHETRAGHDPIRHPGRAPLDRRPGQPGLRLHQGEHRRLGIDPHAALLLGVVLLVAFVLVEARSTHPLLPLRVVAERNRGGSFLASLLTGAGLSPCSSS